MVSYCFHVSPLIFIKLSKFICYDDEKYSNRIIYFRFILRRFKVNFDQYNLSKIFSFFH
jgi:hypothetical protein